MCISTTNGGPRVAYYLVEDCELKADSAKSYLGYAKDFHFALSKTHPYWTDFEKVYSKIRKSKRTNAFIKYF